MPIETYQDPSTGLIIQRVVGDLVPQEVIAAQRRLYLEEKIDPRTPVLWDARNSTPSDRTFADMSEMASQSEDFWEAMQGGRTAIVTASKVDFGMGRMYETLADRMPREIQVFMDYQEAVEWLTGGTSADETNRNGNP